MATYNDSTIESSTLTIRNGETAENLTIATAGRINVNSGGTATTTEVLEGGVLTVNAYGSTLSASVRSGGSLNVVNAAYVSSVVVDSGGWLSGYQGSAYDVTLASGAQAFGFRNLSDKEQNFYAFNSAWAYISGQTMTDLDGQGNVALQSGALVTNGIVRSGSYWDALDRAEAQDVDVYGQLTISNGGMVSNIEVLGGGRLVVNVNGSALSTTVRSGGSLNAANGASVSGVTIDGGGWLSGYQGSAYDVTLASGGYAFGFTNLSEKNQTFDRFTSAGAFVSGRTMTELNAQGTLYVQNGAIISKGDFSGYLYVSSGATINDFTLNGGWAYVSSGCVVSDVTVNSGAGLSISSGGFAADVVLSGGGSMTIADYGSASNVSLDSGASIYVARYGVVSNATLEVGALVGTYNGRLNIISAPGSMSLYRVNSWGGYLNGNLEDISYKGNLSVVSGTVRDVSGDILALGAGVTASGVTAGTLYASSGATVDDAVINGYGYVAGGASVTSLSLNGGWAYVSSGCVVSDVTVNSGAGLSVSSGGFASDVVLSGGGSMTIADYGSASNVSLDSGASIYVARYGVVSNATLEVGALVGTYNGRLNIISAPGSMSLYRVNSWGGYLNGNFEDVSYKGNLSILSGTVRNVSGDILALGAGVTASGVTAGTLYASSGATVDDAVINGYGYVAGGASVTLLSLNGGWAYVSSGCVVSDVTVNSGAGLSVSSGGFASDVVLSGGGSMTIADYGSASNVSLDSGASIYVARYGVVSNVTLEVGALVSTYNGRLNIISAPGPVSLYRINSWGGYANGELKDIYYSGSLYLASGAYANINASGTLHAGSGAIVTDATVSGYGYVADGASVTGLSLNGGWAYVSSGCVVSDVTVSSGAGLSVSSGGFASDVVLSGGGSMTIADYGSASNVSLDSGASIYVARYGMVSNATLEVGALVSTYNGRLNIISAPGSLSLYRVNSWGGYANGELKDIYYSGNLYVNSGSMDNIHCFGGVMTVNTLTSATEVEVNSGTLYVSSGAFIENITLTNNATIGLYTDGIINGLTLNSTTYRVSNGSAVSRGQANDGGVFVLSSGGRLATGNVTNGGLVHIYGYGYASGVTISSGGEIRNYSSGNIEKVVVESSGILTISGGVATDVQQQEGARLQLYLNQQEVVSGSNANDVFSISGGTAHNLLIHSDGLLSMGSGCSAIDTVMESGGRIQLTLSSAEDSKAISGVNENGAFFVMNGVATDVILHSGAYLRVSSGASAVNTVAHSSATVNGFLFQNVSKVEVLRDGELDVANVVIRESAWIASGHSISESLVETGGLTMEGVGMGLTISGSGSIGVMNGGVLSKAVVSGISGRNGGDLCIRSGGTLYSAAIDNYGDLYMLETGEAHHTVVHTGGRIYLGADWGSAAGDRGGIAYDTILESGGSMRSYESGSANRVTMKGGASLTLSGGQIEDVTVSSGGYLYVYSGVATQISAIAGATINGFTLNEGRTVDNLGYGKFTVSNATVNYLEHACISSGYSATNIRVIGGYNYGAGLHVYDGALLDSAYVTGGYYGQIWVSRGGVARNTVLANGQLDVIYSGVAIGTVASSGGYVFVNNGGVISNTTVLSRGYASAYSGGSVLDATVNKGGAMTLSNGGYASNVMINSQGGLNIYSRSIAEDISLMSGGSLVVASGGTAIIENYQGGFVSANNGALVRFLNLFIGEEDIMVASSNWEFMNPTVEAGGELRILAGGRLYEGTIQSDGYLVVTSGATVSALTLQSGGYAELNGGVTVSALTLAAGATIGDLTNVGSSAIVLESYSNGVVTGRLENASFDGVLSIATGTELKGLSGSFTLRIDDTEGDYIISGNDFSQVTLELNGDGIIDLSGNYWGTTDIDAIYERLGADSTTVRIDDVLGRNPNAAVFALESTNLNKNYLAPGQTSISFIFNALLDETTISRDSISFVSTSGKTVSIEKITVHGNNLMVEFNELTAEGVYTIRLADTIRDTDGNALTSIRHDNLAVGIGEQLRITARLSGASVVKVSPAGDIAGTLTSFRVYFSKSVDPTTLLDNVKMIAPNGTAIVPTSVRMLNDSTAEFTVPAQTAAGKYSVQVAASVADYAGTPLDQNGNGVVGEADDGFASMFALTEIDLSIKDVQVAETLTAGEDVAITWKVANESGTALMGSWTDGVYLSTDARWDIGDTLLATYTHENGLDAGAILSAETSLGLLGVSAGSYYLLVRSDIHNDEDDGVADAVAAQNLVATRVTVEVPQLSVGETATGRFTASGDFASYRVRQQAGEALQFELDSQIAAANVEFYVGYGQAPSREQYDAKLQRITDATMTIDAGIVPRDVYILVYAKSTTEAFDYTLSARKAPASIERISQSGQDGSEDITLTVTGRNFTNGMTVRLVAADGTATVLDDLKLSGTSQLTTIISADTLSAGDYTLELVDGEIVVPGKQSVFINAVTGEGKLEYFLDVPSSVLLNGSHTFNIIVSNTGTAPIDAPLVFFTPTHFHTNGKETRGASLSLNYDQSAFWVSTMPAGYSDSLSFFVNGEVAGTLQSGESISVPIYYNGWRGGDWSGSHINWNVYILETNDSTILNWDEIFQNSGFSFKSGQKLAQVFSAEFGNTWGGYYAMVVGNLHYLDEIGFSADIIDTSSMLRFEAMQKTNVLQPFHNLAESDDLELAGNSIIVRRTYDIGQETMKESGSFGNRWTFNWDVNLQKTANGDVQIVQGGKRRIYQPTATFGYQTACKDGSSLKNNVTGYRLTDVDGSQWQFDLEGRLLYVVETTGDRISCTYNIDGRLVRLTNTSTGSYVSFVRDAETGLITAVKDSAGRSIAYTYSEDGDLLSVTDSTNGLIAAYEYYASLEHALTKITNGTGDIINYAYDALGRIVSIPNANGTTSLSYGAAGEITLTNRDAQITLYYAPSGNIAKITDDKTGKVYTYHYDANGVFVSGEDSDGNALTSQFDFGGQEFDVCYSGVDFSNLAFNAVYNTNINTNHYVVDGITYYKTDGDGNILRQNDKAEEYYVTGYDEVGNIVSYEYLKNGVTTTYTFNEDGSVSISEDDPSQYFVVDGIKYFRKDMEGNVLGQYDTDVDSYTLGYDANGNRVFYAYTRNGETTSYQYDVAGNMVSMTNADGTTAYTYDENGNKMTETAPDGTVYLYDANGNLTSQTDVNGKITSYAYDANGNIASITSDGKTALYEYDADGNLTDYTDARGNVYAYTYDTEGRQTSVTVNGKTTSYTYDENGNYSSITDATGNTSLYSYNADGALLQFTDANGNVTTYSYDEVNDLMQITYADGTFEVYSYNTDGDLLSWTGRAGQTAVYSYNANGDYTGVVYSDGKENTYTYNADGYLLSANDIVFTYDANGNRTAQSFVDGRSIQYTYNDEGQMVGYADELGHAVNYTYTVDGGYDVLTDESGGLIVDYDYDIDGYLIKAAYGNDTYTIYTYDDFGQVTAIDNYASDGTVSSFIHYAYDSEGKRTSMVTVDGTWAYAYDVTDQLIGAVFTDNTGTVTQELAYTYDAMGNRLTAIENGLTTTYTYNNLNQIVSANSFEYVYDATGNLLEDEKRLYTWTADNRIASETLKSTGQTWEYGYDALGNRVSSTTNGITTSWTVDASGNVLSEYVDGVWNRTYYQGNLLTGFVDKDGNEYFYNVDALGTTISVTSADGLSVNTYAYDPWGNVLNSTEGVANDFTFVGGYGLMQNDSGTYFVRARNYDPQTGRWISPDPIGIEGGENLYVLLGNDPINDIDISGYGSFYERPLSFLEYKYWVGGAYITNPITGDDTNLNVYHEHYIGNGFNVGYHGESGNYRDAAFFGLLDGFYSLTGLFSENVYEKFYRRLERKEYQDNAIRVAARMEAGTGNWMAENYTWFTSNDYNIITHNCQDFADALRSRYYTVLPIADASNTENKQLIPKELQNVGAIKITLNADASWDQDGIKGTDITDFKWFRYDEEDAKWIECSSTPWQKVDSVVTYGLAVCDSDNCWNEYGIQINKDGKEISDVSLVAGSDCYYLSTTYVIIGNPPPIANAGKNQSYTFVEDENSCSFTVSSINSKAFGGASLSEYFWSLGGATYNDFASLNIKVNRQPHKQTDSSGNEFVTYSYKWYYWNTLVSSDSSLDISLTVKDSNGLLSGNPASVTLSVSSSSRSAVRNASDPNDKTVAEGVGEAGYVQSGSKLSYTIEFENDPEFATAPAQWVRVFDTLDGSKYDLDSFVLEEFCIAGNTFVVGDGRDSFNRTVELSILDYTITATISINLVRDEDMEITQLVAEFMAVDPESGFLLQDLENGLLPVNDAFGSGEGHISYTINAWNDLPSGTEITNTAKIYFDFNDPIDTPTTLNTIDDDAPNGIGLEVSADDNGLITVAMSATDAGAGVAGYNLRWSTDGEQFIDYGYTTYPQLQLSGLGGMTYYFQAQAVDAVGLISEWSDIQSVAINGTPTGLSGDAVGLSWKAVAGAETYVVEYSTDDFEHFVRIQVAGTSLDSFRLPAGSYRWRVRAGGLDEWQEGETIISADAADIPKLLQSNDDNSLDVFFGKANDVWNGNYEAQHVGVGEWKGTNEMAELAGKNAVTDIFAGSDDASILLLGDDANGDALFIDDIYSAFPEGLDAQARIAKINEIRAGDGNDIVDLTSQRFDYIGGGMTVKGGLGDDIIWANSGDNTLFGDAGNDRIVGAGGNDVIVGGSGDDSLHGGGGEDIFAFGGNWSNDSVEQLEDGKVTLWFDDGSLDKWDAASLTYRDGDKSVVVSGVTAENISLKFGDDGSEQYGKLLESGAFDEFGSERIFENKNTRGMLA